uniref:AAA+ ATPase domain-containing protein n=1 Tax=Branchiostoma floridae TaxID=7739 RepID=C3YA59_BRAFL|eukprot:XP_002606597.1 hypothetical protein BRAFLDRAFT_120109 [Branchiostoma floridae]
MNNLQVLNEQKEAHILIQALRDANLPKFLAEDVPLFESILADLFPGIVFPEPESGVLEKAIHVSIRDLGLQLWPLQLEKVVQLYRQIMVRHGVMLVGPTGGGKTTCRNILQRALVLMPAMQEEGTVGMQLMGTGKKGKVETFTLNPKCVKLGELYGATDPNTLEWTDGLMASAVRRFARELTAGPETQADEWDQRPPTTASMGSGYTRTDTGTPATPEADIEPDAVADVKEPEGQLSTHKEEIPTDWRWLVLDGPVDTLWVENLNTGESHLWVENLNTEQVLDGPVDTLWVENLNTGNSHLWVENLNTGNSHLWVENLNTGNSHLWVENLNTGNSHLWGENLNTVLDDTKTLCLANGERISLPSGIRLTFEVDNLSQASPATISRCAMVYMDPVDLGWRPFVKTWLTRLPRDIPETGRTHLEKLFELSIDDGLAFMTRRRKHQHLPATELGMVSSLCRILSALLDFMGKNGGFGVQGRSALLDFMGKNGGFGVQGRSALLDFMGKNGGFGVQGRSALLDFMGKNGGFGVQDEETEERPDSASSRHSSASRSSATSRDSRRQKKKRREERRAQLYQDALGKKGRRDDKKWYMEKHPRDLAALLGKMFVFALRSYSSLRYRDDKKWDDKKWYMEKHPRDLAALLGKMFVFAFTSSIRGNLVREDDHDEDAFSVSTKEDSAAAVSYDFDNFIHDKFEIEPPMGVRLPTGNKSIFGYFVDMQTGNFVLWDSLVPTTQSLIERGLTHVTLGEAMGMSAEQSRSMGLDSQLIPTVDTVRYSFLMALLLLHKNPVLLTDTVRYSFLMALLLLHKNPVLLTDTVRYSFLMALLLLHKNPVLLTGDSGVGKSAIVQDMLSRLTKDGGTATKGSTILGSIFHFAERSSSILENISSLTSGFLGDKQDSGSMSDMVPSTAGSTVEVLSIGSQGVLRPKVGVGVIASTFQFSAQTSAARTQHQITNKLIKKGRDAVGGPRGKKVLVFIDDLNMPAPEQYGAQPPLELLRQYLELGGFYDTKKLTWKDVLDVTLVGACAPPGGGRNQVSARLLKHFSMLCLPQPSSRSLQHIYQVQLGRFFENGDFMPEVKECQKNLVSAGIAVYYKMCGNMLPTPAKSHYTFNLRDLSEVIRGLLQADETVIVSRETAAQLFAHEATRVFHDRLVDDVDRMQFHAFLSDDLHNYFKVTWTAQKLCREPVMFGDFLDMHAPSSVGRVYRYVTNKKKLAGILEEYHNRLTMGSQVSSVVHCGVNMGSQVSGSVVHCGVTMGSPVSGSVVHCGVTGQWKCGVPMGSQVSGSAHHGVTGQWKCGVTGQWKCCSMWAHYRVTGQWKCGLTMGSQVRWKCVVPMGSQVSGSAHHGVTMESQEKPLVFFTEAVEHITRAARVFRQPGGHMMMVGLDGTGKASSTELACHISQCELYKLNITRNYLHADFRDDLKKVFHMAGVQGSKTVLLLNDADIIMESFLEDVNSILNSGEVPDLFDNDELDAISMELKSAALEAGIPDTRQAVYQLFIQRVQTKLHIVLAMSPAGHTFRQRCRAHPALINCCTIDWYNEWPEEALLSVAHAYFSLLDFGTQEGQDTQALRESVAGVCVDIHSSVTTAAKQYYQELRRFYYTTPTSYLELIQLYSRMLESSRQLYMNSSYLELIQLYSRMLKSSRQLYMNSRDRLLVGLSKLSEANSLVGTMQEELVALGPKIEEKARDTELLMQQLAKDQEAVDEVRLIVEQEEQTMAKEARIIEDYAEEATRDLQSVLPALQTAITALDALDKSDISEIRVYTNPPVLFLPYRVYTNPPVLFLPYRVYTNPTVLFLPYRVYTNPPVLFLPYRVYTNPPVLALQSVHQPPLFLPYRVYTNPPVLFLPYRVYTNPPVLALQSVHQPPLYCSCLTECTPTPLYCSCLTESTPTPLLLPYRVYTNPPVLFLPYRVYTNPPVLFLPYRVYTNPPVLFLPYRVYTNPPVLTLQSVHQPPCSCPTECTPTPLYCSCLTECTPTPLFLPYRVYTNPPVLALQSVHQPPCSCLTECTPTPLFLPYRVYTNPPVLFLPYRVYTNPPVLALQSVHQPPCSCLTECTPTPLFLPYRVYTNPPVLALQSVHQPPCSCLTECTPTPLAVCTLLQQKPDWATAKQQLSDPSFLKRLVTLDKNSIPNKVWKKLKQYSKHADFTPERVGGVSLACKSMCQWVLALEHYMEVYRMVEPKQKKVREAKEALEIAKGNLKAKQESLAKIQDHLRILQQQYQDSVNQRESLRERKVLTTKRLERASILTTALADERVRWKDSAHDQDVKLHGVVGDTLLSAANVGYLGVFNAPYRRLLVSQWLTKCQAAAIPVSKDYTLVNALSDKNKVRQWHNEGLPQDKHSVENAVVIKSGHRWPLIIDPQGQGKKWICGMEGERLKTLQAADPNYLKILENAIRVGEPVLLEEVGESLDPGLHPILEVGESLDPGLHPILVRKIIHRGGQDLIRLGDTEIEFNQNFRLYMTTSMPNPHFLPAVCIKVNIINFTVTFEGLQEQLLSTVVQQERPDLEQQHAQLLESIAADLQLLRDLEDKSLSLLQKSEGHILDDQDLIETLQRSKQMSAEITQRVGESEETEKNINQARQKYLPVATRGAVLYFVLADLAMVDVMYQFSLPWFQRMFRQCVDYLNIKQSLAPGTPARPLSGTLRPQSARSSPDISHPAPATVKKKPDLVGQDLTAHLMKMIDTLTESVYKVVSQALFAHHQLMFSFLLCTSIMRNNAVQSTLSEVLNSLGGLVEKQWLIFLHTPIFANMMDAETEQQTDGLTPMQRLEMQAGIGSDPSSPNLTPSSSRRSSVSGTTPFIGTYLLRLTHFSGKSTMPKWLTAEKWRQCQYVCSTMEEFSQLCHSLVSSPEQWQLLLRMDDPFHAMATRYVPLEEIKGLGSRPGSGRSVSSRPGSGTQERSTHKTSAKKVLFKWEELTAFQRLLLIKILQPEMLKASIRSFVEEKMGVKFLSTGDFDLKEVFEESDAKTPLIFILSHGEYWRPLIFILSHGEYWRPLIFILSHGEYWHPLIFILSHGEYWHPLIFILSHGEYWHPLIFILSHGEYWRPLIFILSHGEYWRPLIFILSHGEYWHPLIFILSHGEYWHPLIFILSHGEYWRPLIFILSHGEYWHPLIFILSHGEYWHPLIFILSHGEYWHPLIFILSHGEYWHPLIFILSHGEYWHPLIFILSHGEYWHPLIFILSHGEYWHPLIFILSHGEYWHPLIFILSHGEYWHPLIFILSHGEYWHPLIFILSHGEYWHPLIFILSHGEYWHPLIFILSHGEYWHPLIFILSHGEYWHPLIFILSHGEYWHPLIFILSHGEYWHPLIFILSHGEYWHPLIFILSHGEYWHPLIFILSHGEYWHPLIFILSHGEYWHPLIFILSHGEYWHPLIFILSHGEYWHPLIFILYHGEYWHPLIFILSHTEYWHPLIFILSHGEYWHPLIFILSHGSDPAAQLMRFAKEVRGSTLHIDMISLGRGQGPKAEELIQKAHILKGRWVFLQNCHLAASFMPRLQAIVDRWANQINKQTNKQITWALPPGCLLHAQAAGHCGQVSLQMLQALMVEEDGTVPWSALLYLTGEVVYGGRVTDAWDRRCLHSILQRFLCPEALNPGYSYSSDELYKPLPNSYSLAESRAYIDALPNSDSPDIFGMHENAENAFLRSEASELIETIISVQPRLTTTGVIGSGKSSDEIVLEVISDISQHLPETVEQDEPVTARDRDAGSRDRDAGSGGRTTLNTMFASNQAAMRKKSLEKQCGGEKVGQEDPDDLSNSALVTVLRQEIDRYNRLLAVVHSSLRSLTLAVKGEVVMSEHLEEAYNSFLVQRVPEKWQEAAYESCKPLGSWVKDLAQRTDFFSTWADLVISNMEKKMGIGRPVSKPSALSLDLGEGEVTRDGPRSFWLSGFFFPQGFLTGVLQNHARKTGVSVDSLTFDFHVKTTGHDTEEALNDTKQGISVNNWAFKQGQLPPEAGVLVFGLYLDGARWDPKSESLQDTVTSQQYSRLPEIHFDPVQLLSFLLIQSTKLHFSTSSLTALVTVSQLEREASSLSDSSPAAQAEPSQPAQKRIYECPLYRTSRRAGNLSSTGHSTNFVTAVNLPSLSTADHWVTRGVAMLCQLDD